jgi:UDP-2-acetamido-2-deoxy-ribo-hexuluronate aminotransferase
VHYPVTLDRQPALAGLMSGSPSLPVSHRLAERVVSLPMHPYLDEATIGTIAQALTAATASLPSVH